MIATAGSEKPATIDHSGLRRVVDRLHRPGTAIAVIAVCLAVVQLVTFDLGRYLAYDEAIYLSEVYPAGTPIEFTAPRARGLPWLVAPVALFSPPIWLIRLYLLTLSSGLFFAAFRVWLPVIGTARTAVAAVWFGAGWMSLHYGSELFPNQYVALGAIFAAGSFARHLTTSTHRPGWRSRPLWATAAAVTVVAVIRPTEATMITCGLGASALLATGQLRRLLVMWSALAAGLLAGWLPWVIEAFARYGGLRARLAAASENVGGGIHPENLRSHLALVDGPLTGGVDSPVPVVGVLLWVVLVAGAVAAFGRSRFGSDHRAAVAAAVGLAAAAQYLFTDVVQARFLLPAYGLLIVAAVAAVPAVRSPAARRGYAVAGALALLLWLPHELTVADRLESEQAARRQNSLHLAAALRAQAGPGPCYFASQFGFPEIAFSSDCRGSILRPARSQLSIEEPPEGVPVYLLSVTHPADLPVPAVPGTARSLRDQGAPRWWISVAAPEAFPAR